MKIYSKDNVYKKAIDRIDRLFDEFDNVVVGFSGGKDSTVTLNLALEVARKKNRLPLTVMWIDQEAEWQGTVDYCEMVFSNPEIKPLWFQMPMVITNNASIQNRYSHCWNEKKEKQWVHKKNKLSIKVNNYGTDRFHELFAAIFKVEYPNTSSCYLSGVRTEESPKRMMSLTSAITYKDITWGKVLDKKKQHYSFYPIYDWSYTDVWKYIHDNKIPYNRVYDKMYQHGVNVQDMRISNLHHETAIQNLLLVQEIEPETWEKLSTRIAGSNAIKHLKSDAYTCPKELPYMFKSWGEYALYLNDNITQDKKHQDEVLKKIEKNKKYLVSSLVYKDFYKMIINTILSSDWDFTKLKNFLMSPRFNTVKKYVNNKITKDNYAINKKYDKYIKDLI